MAIKMSKNRVIVTVFIGSKKISKFENIDDSIGLAI